MIKRGICAAVLAVSSIAAAADNRPPELQATSPGQWFVSGGTTVRTGKELRFVVLAADPDGDELTFSAEGLPKGARFDADSQEFVWTPGPEAVGQHRIKFVVSDGAASASGVVRLNVVENRPPTIDESPKRHVTSGSELDLVILGHDEDGDTLTFRADGLPRGAELDAKSGRIRWKPEDSQTGIHSFRLIASDGEKESEPVTARIEVVEEWSFQMMAAVRSERVIEIMAEATNVIAEGEVLQLMNARDPDTTEQRYLEVIHRKTAKLFQAGAEVAAVVSGAERAVQQALARFGKHLGTAYQLIDDVLDYQSDPETRGKNLGDDLAEGKPTLPLIHALRMGDATAKKLIRAAIEGGGREQLSAILHSIESTGGLQYTARLAHAEADQALAALSVLPETPFRSGLAALARFAIDRKH